MLEYQQALRKRMERQPVRFMTRELEPLLDEARKKLSRFVGCSPESLVWVSNATTGVNAVLRSLRFEAGEEILQRSRVSRERKVPDIDVGGHGLAPSEH